MAAKISVLAAKKDSAYWSQLAQAAVTDEEAFTELYNHFFPRIYRHLLAKTKDNSLADEFVSTTFINMYHHLKDFDPQRGAFSTWLFRIAQNVLLKHYGSKTYTAHAPWEDDFDPAAPGEEEPEKQYLAREREEALRLAMMQLSERSRRILEMTYWLDMKSNEIGEVLGMAPSSVRVALKQARDKLRELLGKDD